MGKLNFCSQFVPDYRQKVRPLILLLSMQNAGKWMAVHTQVVNDLATIVQQWICLGLTDFSKPGRLHVDSDEQVCSAILVQGTGNSYHVIVMIGHEIQATETSASLFEWLLLMA